RFIRMPNGAIVDTGDGPVQPGADYIPGDGIYQGDQRYMFGGRGSWTRDWVLHNVPLQTEIGVENRNDSIHVTLQRQVRRQSFFVVNNVAVRESSFSGYVAQQIFFSDWLRLETGFRGDFYTFDDQ